ncbi:MAG: hypothetical protein LBF17_01285 [Mediterranea sp.]|nr:hypothetical protein [Mediterranea sp.]
MFVSVVSPLTERASPPGNGRKAMGVSLHSLPETPGLSLSPVHEANANAASTDRVIFICVILPVILFLCRYVIRRY